MSNYDQRNQKVETQLNADKINVGLKPITCPKCKHGNPAKAKFCSDCGTSLVFKCQICQEESPVGSKFCSGCGVEVENADAKIKFAEKMRGGASRELSYSFMGYVYNKLNPLSYLNADRHVMRFTIDADEYVIKVEESVLLTKGEIGTPSGEGKLYLTNKRLIMFAVEPVDRIDYNVLVYPYSDLTDVKFVSTKVLFGVTRKITFLCTGRFRTIDGYSDTFNEEWVREIQRHSQ